MINEKDILAMLQNGENADDIAQKLIDTLNKGKELYDEELAAKAKADAEAKAKAIIDAEKEDAMEAILDSIYEFIYTYYCDDEDDVADLDKAFEGFSAKDAIAAIEQIGSLTVELTNLLEGFDFPTKKPTKKTKISIGPNDADFVINSFLKSIGL